LNVPTWPLSVGLPGDELLEHVDDVLSARLRADLDRQALHG